MIQRGVIAFTHQYVILYSLEQPLTIDENLKRHRGGRFIHEEWTPVVPQQGKHELGTNRIQKDLNHMTYKNIYNKILSVK